MYLQSGLALAYLFTMKIHIMASMSTDFSCELAPLQNVLGKPREFGL